MVFGRWQEYVAVCNMKEIMTGKIILPKCNLKDQFLDMANS